VSQGRARAEPGDWEGWERVKRREVCGYGGRAGF